MTETTKTTKTADKTLIAQAQERVSGTASSVVETIRSNPKTAAAIAVGAAAAVAGVAYRDRVADAVTSVRDRDASNQGA